MDEILGRVMTVAGSQMTVNLEADHGNAGSLGIGAMVKARSADHEVVATISAVQCESNSPAERILIADLLGEIVSSGIASSVKHCDITCTAGSSNRPFDSTPPEPQSPVVPSHLAQRTAPANCRI